MLTRAVSVSLNQHLSNLNLTGSARVFMLSHLFYPANVNRCSGKLKLCGRVPEMIW